jgi:hypothetical protein
MPVHAEDAMNCSKEFCTALYYDFISIILYLKH